MGYAFEDTIIKLFSDHGIQALSGEYVDGSGEIDILIESDTSLHIIEAKKKNLTRKARAGEDVYLFIDVFLSYIKSQIQLFRHELRFRKEGFIEINLRSGGTRRIEYLNRELDKISLSLHDYEGLQYRFFNMQTLPRIIERNWVLAEHYDNSNDGNVSSEQEIIRKFNSIGVLSESLRDLAKELIEMGVETPFFDSWFLSFGNISMLLDGVTNTQGFSKNLKNIKHVSGGTMNTYAEYSTIRRLNA
jgi:hypothetical protein